MEKKDDKIVMGQLLTVKDVAVMMGISCGQIYALVRAKQLPAVKIGSLVRFDRNVLTEWIKANSGE